MNTNVLTRIATIAAIIAGVSLTIAGVIGVTSGSFRLDAAEHAAKVTVDERKSLSAEGINNIAVNVVSENITIRECSGDDIKAWFHGTVSSTSPDNGPHLEVRQRGNTAEIRIERKQNAHIGFGSICNNAVLEVSIPRQFAGQLSAQGVSADITLGTHDYTELALTTVSGDIETDATVAVAGDVDAHSTSGDVAFAFSKMPGKIDAETISGDVRLAMPPNATFSLDAHSISGDVTCDFPVTLTGSSTGGGEHNLGGTVGSGKGTVKAGTVSGDIGITRNGGM